jgi:polysaccharide biosynthesis/export protein
VNLHRLSKICQFIVLIRLQPNGRDFASYTPAAWKNDCIDCPSELNFYPADALERFFEMSKKLLFSVIVLCFWAGLGLSQDIPVDMQKAKGYQLYPGDEVTGKVLGENQFDFVSTVNEDGYIEVPFFPKPINAKCRTERELRADVTQLLSTYLRSPQLSLRITDRKSRPPATIYGEVRMPQQVLLMRKATLVELLAFSGGVTEEAGGTIQVFRTQAPFCSDGVEENIWKNDSNDPTSVPSRTYSLANVKLGKEDANPIIYPGDVIVVQKASPVYITGEAIAPQGIYLKEGGMTLTEAIAKIGGVRREAKTKDIKIYRLKSANAKDRDIISVNYDLIKSGKQKDIKLEAYDIVEVDKAKDSIAQSILKIAVGAGRQAVGSLSGGVGYRVLY